jgi:ribose transport system ATP-binding protein
MAEPDALLTARGVRLSPASPPIELTVRTGEIVGLAGLEGHGQDRFLEVLCGLQPAAAGSVSVRRRGGDDVPLTSLAEATRHGVAYLPRDRRATGVFPGQTVFDNFAIAAMPRHARLGVVRRRGLRQRLDGFRERLSMVYGAPDAGIGTLSGGNQQKVLLARWLACEPRLILMNDPTRGVDLGTRMKLYDTFRELARDEGIPLVVLSTEIEEILQLCDRVLVFREQAVARELAGAELQMHRVIAAMFGQEDAA